MRQTKVGMVKGSKIGKGVAYLVLISGAFAFFTSSVFTQDKAGRFVSADMILYNGKILTVDKDFRIVQAVAIRDGKLLAVGGEREVVGYKGPETEMIDLGGKTVTPGIVDSHCHPIGVGINQGYPVQLLHVRTYDDLLQAIRNGVAKVKPGEWLVTAPNWLHSNFRGKMPPLKVLDELVPSNPLWIACGSHSGCTNSLGLRLAGITKDTPAPAGGVISKDPVTGELTGRLEETAQGLIKKLLPKPVDELTALRTACRYYRSIGVTSIQNDGIGPEDLIAYKTLSDFGELTMRCGLNEMISPAMTNEEIFGMIHAIAGAGLGGLGDDMVKVGGIKTVGESTSLKPMWDRNRLRDICMEIARNKMRFTVHTNSVVNEEILGILHEVNKRYSIKNLRWGLVHQRWTNPAMIKINKDLGLCVNQDVAFGLLSVYAQELERKKALPRDRLFCPLPLWMEAGVPLSLNTDGGGSCTEMSVWAAAYCATNRAQFQLFNPEFNISRKDALKLITMGGAYRMMMEDKIGSIEVGKLADLAVLSSDPLTCTPDELYKMTAVMTILGGKIVYKAE